MSNNLKPSLFRKQNAKIKKLQEVDNPEKLSIAVAKQTVADKKLFFENKENIRNTNWYYSK
jgi:hypothetical protein